MLSTYALFFFFFCVLHLFSTIVSVDTVFVTLFPTTVPTTVRSKLNKLLCTREVPATFQLISTVLVVVGQVLAGRKRRVERTSKVVCSPPPPPSHTHTFPQINCIRFLWTTKPHEGRWLSHAYVLSCVRGLWTGTRALTGRWRREREWTNDSFKNIYYY